MLLISLLLSSANGASLTYVCFPQVRAEPSFCMLRNTRWHFYTVLLRNCNSHVIKTKHKKRPPQVSGVLSEEPTCTCAAQRNLCWRHAHSGLRHKNVVTLCTFLSDSMQVQLTPLGVLFLPTFSYVVRNTDWTFPEVNDS